MPELALEQEYSQLDSAVARAQGRYLGLGEEGRLCGRWGMVKGCDNGHFYLKSLECGREWCPVCGQDHSVSHNRRTSRLVPKIFAMNVVCYGVFEVPLALRPFFLYARALKDARRYIHRLLERELGTRGVSRWHWQGEGGMREFDDIIEEVRFHPHLNVLFEHGLLGRKQIKRLRSLWSKWLYRYCGHKYYKTAPVWFQYYRSASKKHHLAAYVTRPTLKHFAGYVKDFAQELYGFNNQSWFGKWSKADRERGLARYEAWRAALSPSKKRALADIKANEAFNNNKCLLCGGELHYLGVDRVHTHEAIREFGDGLWQVKPPKWSQFYRDNDVGGET